MVSDCCCDPVSLHEVVVCVCVCVHMSVCVRRRCSQTKCSTDNSDCCFESQGSRWLESELNGSIDGVHLHTLTHTSH